MLEDSTDFFGDSLIENAHDMVEQWTQEDWALFLKLIEGRDSDYYGRAIAIASVYPGKEEYIKLLLTLYMDTTFLGYSALLELNMLLYYDRNLVKHISQEHRTKILERIHAMRSERDVSSIYKNFLKFFHLSSSEEK